MYRQIKRQQGYLKQVEKDKSKVKSKPKENQTCSKIIDNKCTNVIVPLVLNHNSNDVDTEHGDNDNDAVTKVSRISLVNDTEYEGICCSDDGEDEEFKDCNTHKSKNQNAPYFTSPHSTSYEISTSMNAHNTDVSVSNEYVNVYSSSSSTAVINNADIMYS